MKFLSLTLIIVGIILIFNLGGISTPAGGYALRFYTSLTTDSSPLSGFKDDSIIWLGISAIAVLLAGIGARAGLFGSAPPVTYFTGAFIIVLAGLILIDFINIFLVLWSIGELWIRGVITLIFIPLSIAYIISLKSSIEGTD